MSTPLEIKLYTALRRIADYMPPDKLRRAAERKYGLSEDEAIEMAYENVLSEATAAIKGVRRPKASAQPDRSEES